MDLKNPSCDTTRAPVSQQGGVCTLPDVEAPKVTINIDGIDVAIFGTTILEAANQIGEDPHVVRTSRPGYCRRVPHVCGGGGGHAYVAGVLRVPDHSPHDREDSVPPGSPGPSSHLGPTSAQALRRMLRLRSQRCV